MPNMINHDYLTDNKGIRQNEKKTLFVLILSALMMFLEIGTGYLSSSMALLADGWHMASHTGAMFITLIAYRLSQNPDLSRRLNFGTGKVIPLGGYTSAVTLGIIGIIMASESSFRLLKPTLIEFNEALVVAILGLLVNLLCAWILGHSHDHSHDHSHVGHDHHDHDHQNDHNIKGAYFHVLADALTSVGAIVALFFAKYYQMLWLDPLLGMLGSLLILKWAYTMCKDSGLELLDAHSLEHNYQSIRSILEDSDTLVLDLHVWKIAPKASACEIVIQAKTIKGSDHYKGLLQKSFSFQHLVIEENVRP